MGFKVPQHWGILGAKISIHDRAKYIWQIQIVGSLVHKKSSKYPKKCGRGLVSKS